MGLTYSGLGGLFGAGTLAYTLLIISTGTGSVTNFLPAILGILGMVGCAIAASPLLRAARRMPVAVDIGSDRLVAWYGEDSPSGRQRLSRSMRFEDVSSTHVHSSSPLANKYSAGYSPARFVGYLEPGLGPKEVDLVLNRTDLADTENRGRPQCAIYLTRENFQRALESYDKS